MGPEIPVTGQMPDEVAVNLLMAVLTAICGEDEPEADAAAA
jgi:hypothetical protein